MKKNENKSAVGAQSMADRYSFGHKVLSVALSAVLVGFGWPAVSPSSVYAEGDAATGVTSQQSAPAAASGSAASQAAPAAGQAASGESAAAPADAGAAAASSSTSAGSAASGSAQGQDSAAAADQAAREADVALVLGNASIAYRDQVIAQPADKVTVPVGEKFEFAALPDTGYTLVQVKLQVKGSDEDAIEADAHGVYTVAATDVAKGATITLVTEKKQAVADTPQDATPIEDAAATTSKADDASAAGDAVESKPSASEADADAAAPTDNEANAGVSFGAQDITANNGTADAFDDAADWAASGDPLKNSLIADVATFASEYGNGISLFAANTQAAETGYAGVFPLVVDNVDVAYFHYNNDVNETLNPTLTPVGTGTLTISNYTTSTKGGAVLFFVKPHANYIFTGIGTDGAGEVYIVGSGNYGSIANYPGINNIMAAAQAQGYVAAFGFARNNPKSTLKTSTLTLSAKSPDMTLSASSSKTENVLPGDTLTFTIRIQPQTTGSGKDKVEGVAVNGATVNGNQVQVSNLVKNSDGSYSGTVDYVVTKEDCERGSVMLDVNATSSYSGTVTPTNSTGGGNGTVVSSYSTITKNASCVCRIAPKNAVDYEFVSGTSGKSLPAGLYTYLPVEADSYFENATVIAKTPEVTEFEDKANNGYWTWAGWDADSKTMMADGITFTGTWNFTANESYTVNYVDEQGNALADPKIVNGKRPGTTVTEKAKDIANYTLVGSESQSLTIKSGNASANVITFTYKKNTANYTINYVWNGTDAKVRDSKTLSGYVGDTMTCTPEVVVGYTPVSWDAKNVTIDADGNASVTFSYYKNVTATANSDEVTYDGQEHSVSGYTTNAPESVTFVGIEAGAKGTNAGDYASTFASKPDAAVDTGDKYLITKYENGNLRIKKSDAAKTIVVTGNSAEVVYNGQEQSVSGFTVEGLDDSSIVLSAPEQSAVVAKGTDASDEPYATDMAAEQFTLTSHNYSNLELIIRQGKLTITKRPLTITGNGWDTDQAYTGQEYSTDAVSVEMAVEGGESGLVVGQRCSIDYSLSGTNAGSYTGAFGTPVVKSGTRNVTANYDINLVPGALRIQAARLADKVTLTTENASKVYDAQPLEAKPASAVDEANPTYAFKIEYQKADGTWTTDPTEITATNVADSLAGASAVKVRVSDPAGNYTGELTGSENVVVTKRPATITGSGWEADQPYTGQEYKNTDYSVEQASGENDRGVLDGQTVEASYELVGTEVGEYSGAFKGGIVVKSGDEDVTANYDLSTVAGTLHIVKGEIAKHVMLTPANASKVYDGTPLAAGMAKATDDNGKTVTVEYQKSDGTWTTDPADITATDVVDSLTGEKAINVRASCDAYEGYVTGTQTLEITARSIEFVGESKTVTYNGAEQSATGITVAAAAEGQVAGLVDGQAFEGLTYAAKGTAAGEYAGEFSGTLAIKSAAGTDVTSNYAVAQTPGALTINPLSGVTVTITGNSATKTYTGQQQEVSGFTFKASTPLYGEGDFALAEDKTALAQATHVSDSCSMGLAPESFANVSGNFADVTFVIAQDGGIIISPAGLTVVTDSAEKTYDGTPLTADGRMNGLVNGEIVAFEATGSQTEAGESENTYKIDWSAQDNTARQEDYTVKESPGLLKVNPKAIDAAGMTVGNPHDVVYNGLSQQVKPEVRDGSAVLREGEDYELKFSANVTNVGEVTVTVKGVGNYSGSVDRTYNITPAKLTVKTDDASKVYDGAPLTAPGTLTGLVNGETATFKVTGSQTEVGSGKNTYAITWNGTAQASNYQLASETLGTLTVTPQSITPGDNPSNPDPSYKGIAINDPADVPYDGAEHLWEPTVVDGAGNVLVKGRDYAVTYPDNQDFKNVMGDIVATITGMGNYKGTVEKRYQVTALPVTVKTESATKVYDGTPLAKDEGSIEGLIAGESDQVVVVPNGTRTEVGQADNTYTINWNGVRSSNYKLAKEDLGALAVTPQSIVPGTEDDPNPAYDGVAVDSPADHVYDGVVHKWVPTVTDKVGNPLTAADYNVAYDTDDFTNVTGAITVIVTGKGNYAGTVTRTYQITPAPLTIKTPGAEKVYDGTPLTKAASADECVKGLVADENVGFATTGSQTEVGDSDNTYELTWNGTAQQRNYMLESVTLGKLVVKESADEIVVTTTGGEFTYDGEAHGATVSVSDLPAGYTLEHAESTANATDVTAGPVAATADVLVIRNAQGEDVTAKLNIKRVDGSISISPAELTVETPDASKVYDGTPLTAAGTLTGLVNGETATFTTTGSQTPAGTSPNTYEIAWDGTAKAGNYTVSETVGTLTVTKQSIVPGEDPNDPDPAYFGIQVGQLDDTVYNGGEQKFEPKVTDASGAALVKDRDYTLSWSADTTNAGTVKVTVTGKGNYTGSVERAYAIAKRPVSLKSETASKVYDGMALERPDVAVTSQYDFVAGEVSAIEATGSIANAGSVVNAIELTTTAAFKASNYDIAKDEGTLTVTKAAASAGITLVAQSASKLYDGTALALPEATASAKDASGVTVEYQKADGTWTKNAASITALNVPDSREVQVRASSERNFEGYVYGTAQLSVGVRNVTLKSESASKVYDGAALERPDVTVSGDGFVEGEVSDLRATGSIVAVGSVSNAIAYQTGERFVSGNYNIVLESGMLTVAQQSIVPGTEDNPNPAYDGVAVDFPTNHVYDGVVHKWVPAVADKAGNPLTAADYDVAYSTDDFTNVTGAIEVTITGKGNYAGTVTRTYQITPAPLTVETESDSKTYDGAPLVAGGSVQGVVAGETFDFAATGSQTEVGSSKNTYSLEWNGTANAANYQVVEERIGTLTVNEFADEVTVTTTGGEFTYDGQAHGATVTVTGLPAGYHVEQAYSNASARNVADGQVAAGADVLVIKNAQGEDVTTKLNIKRVDGVLKINPAELTVTTGSAEKAYDGTPAANEEATVAGAQGADRVFVWATGEQTEVGSSANTYGISWGTADSRNYLVTEHLGTLTVSSNMAVVEIKGASASKTYDGSALATNDIESVSGLPTGFTAELVASGSQTDAGSSENTVASYIIKNQYGEDATAFFPNVAVEPGTLTVAPAELRVVTEGASKVYDGAPLTNSNGSIEGLVDGQTATVVPNGSQTEVGSSENGYTISWGTAKAGNYQVTSEALGTLTVTESAEPIVVTTVGGTFTYDGQAHGATVTVSQLPEGYTLEAAVSSASAKDVADGVVAATADQLIIRNAQGQDVTSNLSIVKVDGEIAITPAALSVVTEGATKQFDGQPLVNSSMSITGLVPGDSVTARTIGSQTEVGSSANAYELRWTGADARNYTVKEQLGELTVTAAPAMPETPATPGGTTPGGNNPGGGTTPGGNNPGGDTPTNQTPAPTTPIDAVAQVLESAVDAVMGEDAGVAEEQIFDNENPLGTSTHADCWVHYFMLLGMVLTVLYGAGVMGRRGRFSHGLAANMNDVLDAKKND